MAFSTNTGGFGRRGRATPTPLGEINIIPLVDVVLVLLIIFMLTAHVMEFGMEVDVPKTRLVKDTAEVLPVINITREGELFLVDKPVNINELASAIQTRFGTSKAVYVRSDKDTRWEVVANVFSELGQAKIDVRAVTQPEEKLGPRRK